MALLDLGTVSDPERLAAPVAAHEDKKSVQICDVAEHDDQNLLLFLKVRLILN